jgi:hypothetical protein
MADKLSNNALFSSATSVIVDAQMANLDANVYVSGENIFAKWKSSTGVVYTYQINQPPPPVIFPATSIIDTSGSRTTINSFRDAIRLNQNDTIELSSIISANYTSGTSLQVLVNYAPTAATAGNFTWTLGYNCTNIPGGSIFQTPTNLVAVTASPAVTNQFIQTQFTIPSATLAANKSLGLILTLTGQPSGATDPLVSEIIINYTSL